MARDNILRGKALEVVNIHVNCGKVAMQTAGICFRKYGKGICF